MLKHHTYNYNWIATNIQGTNPVQLDATNSSYYNEEHHHKENKSQGPQGRNEASNDKLQWKENNIQCLLTYLTLQQLNVNHIMSSIKPCKKQLQFLNPYQSIPRGLYSLQNWVYEYCEKYRMTYV